MITKAEELRAEAAACDRKAQESFDRCDTDGFLSQWADGITAQQKRLQADIEENGGVWEFPALFDLEGNRVRAKLAHIYSKFAYCEVAMWVFRDKNDHPVGKKFIPAFPKRESTMAKKGYREGMEQAPARARVCGNGHGLAGCASCYVAAVRTDKGYPETARVVEEV